MYFDARVAVAAGYRSAQDRRMLFLLQESLQRRCQPRRALNWKAVTSNNYCKLNNALRCSMLNFSLITSCSFNSLQIIKVTLESGYKYLGKKAFLYKLLFLKKVFILGFYKSCQILSKLICYTLYIYIYMCVYITNKTLGSIYHKIK